MFKSLAKTLRRRDGAEERVEPSVFGDPLALQTDWTPVAPGGASFGTHRLVQPSANRVEFAVTPGAKFFFAVFFFAGSGLLFFQANRIRIGQAELLAQDTLVPILVGVVFAAVGAGLYGYGATPRVFDQARGAFWRSRTEPTRMGGSRQMKSSVPLSSIHALQLLTEYVSGNKSSYYSYELNLVLDDASRINVVDHGDLERLRSDAQTLSRFLDKPLWDATQR